MIRGEQAIEDVFAEITNAEENHPSWPDDAFVGLAIIGEELGEAQQAAIEAKYRNTDWEYVRKEVVQVACTAIRFLIAWDTVTVDEEEE